MSDANDAGDAARRLRLVLGAFADQPLGAPLSGDPQMAEMDRHLGYLYDRAYGEGRGMRKERGGGLGQTTLAMPDWLAHVRDLFPKECLEVVERDAVERFGLTGLLRDPETLEKVERDVERDYFMSSEAAKEYGLIDEVFVRKPEGKDSK